MRSLKPYSNDLRSKIVAVSESTGYSQGAVAALCGVSAATVRNLVRRKRETGSTDVLPPSGGKAAALDEPARSFVQAEGQTGQ